MRNQTMYRTCWLAAALLLAGCSEPNHMPPAVAQDPFAIGAEVFVTQRALDRLGRWYTGDSHPPHLVVGTKVRLIETGMYPRPGSGAQCSMASPRATMSCSTRMS